MAAPADPVTEDVLSQVVQAIRAIRFGCVQITIHDSRVVQIEKAEKIRLSNGNEASRTDRTTGGPQPAQASLR